MDPQHIAQLSFDPPQKIGLFKIFSKSENEIVFGEEDKHLDFKVSLLQEVNPDTPQVKNFYCTTVVKYNNRLGRIYFFVVKPFHKLIVPRMMKQIIKKVSS